MHNSDDKIVSISFDNKKFLDEVQNTIKALDQLNDATSNRNFRPDGLLSLQTTFQTLSKTATANISTINSAIRDNSAYEEMSYNVGKASTSFNALQEIASGAFRAIGMAAVDVGEKVFRGLTSGVRNGWSEYNLLMDSTQTILANTERYGTTMNDVTAALDELNTYADKTIYNFSQMTRNIGYFTTAGQNLEDSVMAIKGMSNLGAFFGANNESVARATYQMSQAMSAGVIRLMDWKSLETASMAGAALQDELINTAAVMSGMSVDAFKEYIGYSKGFRNTLESNWLTADVFRETLRKFAGESREYWESLTASNGERLYSDEEIDRIMRLGETAEESATKVRTFRMMIDSLSESIGSGWAQTFRILIGDLEQAKEFWTPINNLLVSIISGVGNWRNAILTSWADIYREMAIHDMMVGLESVGDIFKAIGTGIARAFGGTDDIANNIGKITEALGDFIYTLRLDEEELEDVSDLVEGLLAPFILLGDIINELTLGFFNSTYRMNDFTRTGNSLADRLRPLRKIILDLFGSIGRVLTRGLNILRQSDAVRNALRFLGTEIKMVAGVIDDALGAAFIYIYNLWNKYDMTNKVISFFDTFIYYTLALGNILYRAGQMLSDWFGSLLNSLSFINFSPLRDAFDILNALKDLLISLVSPSISATDAFNNFKTVVTNSSIWISLSLIKDKIQELFNTIRESGFSETKLQPVFAFLYSLAIQISKVVGIAISGFSRIGKAIKKTAIFDYLIRIKDVIVSLYNGLKNTQVGSFLSSIVTGVSDGILALISVFENTSFGEAISSFINRIKGLFETKVQLKTPNVITSFGNISDNIRTATTKMVDFREFNGKLSSLRNVVDNVKSTISELIPSGKHANGDSNVIKDFLSIISPVGEKADSITKNIEKVGSTFDAIGSIDTDKASENTKKIAIVIAGFVSIFKWLADTTIAFIAVISMLNFSKWSTAITQGLTSLAGAVSGGLTALATSIQISVTAISGAISSWANAVKEQAKAEEFKQIANIFKTLAILAGVLFVGIAIISQFGDPQAFIATMQSFAANLALIMMSIGGMVVMVMLAAGELNKRASLLKISAFKTLLGVSLILWVVQGLLTRVIIFITSISGIATKVASMAPENQEVFFRAIDSMMKMFVVILLAITVMVGVLTALSSRISTLDISSIFGTKTIATITAASLALRGIISSMTFMMVGVAVAIAILVKATPNKELLSAAASILQWFVRVLLAFVAIITFIAGISDSFLIDGLFKAKALLDAATLNFTLFAVSVAGIILALGLVATTLIAAMDSLVLVLSNLEHANRVVRHLKQIMNMVFTFVGMISLVLIAMAVISQQTSSVLEAVSMAGTLLTFAGSMLIISEAMVLIATSISEVAAVISLVGATKLNTAVKAIAGLFLVIALCTGMFIAIGAQTELMTTAIPTILSGAAAMYIAAQAVLVMASGIALLAAVDVSSRKVEAATNGLAKLFGTFTSFFGILSTLLSLLSLARVRVGNGIFGLAGDKGGEIVIILGAITAAIFVMGKSAAIAAAGMALLVRAGSSDQIRAATDGISKLMFTLGTIFGILSAALSVLLAIPGTELVGATIAAVLAAVAGGLLAIGAAIALAGLGLKAGADGIYAYANALKLLETVNTQKIQNNLMVFTETLPMILANIIVTMPLIKDAIIGFFNSLGSAIAEGLVSFITTLYNLLVISQSGVIAMIGSIVVGIIDGLLSVLADFMRRICGNGGRLWEVLEPLGDFLVKAADWLGYYGTFMIGAFIHGMAEALRDSRLIDLLAYSLYTLYAGVTTLFYNTLGVTSLFDLGKIWGSSISEGILQGLVDGLDTFVNIIDLLPGTSRELLYQQLNETSPLVSAILHLADTFGMSTSRKGPHGGGGGSHVAGEDFSSYNAFQQARIDMYDQADQEYQETLRHWNELNDEANEIVSNPIKIGRSNQNENDDTISFITVMTEALGSLFDTSEEGTSLFGGGSIFERLFGDNPFDTGDVSSITDTTDEITDIFNTSGEEAGSSWLDGYTQSLNNVTPVMDDVSADTYNNPYENFGYALESAASLPEEVSNPVITPVVDDTEFNIGVDRMVDTWNRKTYDEFALDAGTSMTLREQAEGDAATDGNVSYNFTQYNYSNQDLTRTELYLDSRNLLRGSGNFRVN